MSEYTFNENNFTEPPEKKTDGPVYVKFKKPEAPQPVVVKRGFGAGAAAVLCVVCLLFSIGSGLVGAFIATWLNGAGISPNGGSDGPVIVDKGVVDNTVVYDPSEHLSIPAVVSKVENSVVEITTEFKSLNSYFVSSGAGSGVILSEDGYIITNNHVIMDGDNANVADSITVRLKSGEELSAKVIGRDEESDIAVLKVNATGLTAVTVGDSSKLVVGEEVVAVGNPLGELGGSVTNGIISALDRKIDVEGNTITLLQTNAAINPGNSGGGLFDMHGNLIGIVNAKYTGEGVEGIGFAIPSDNAYSVFKQLIEYGYVKGKLFLGVTFTTVTNSSTAMHYFGSNVVGVYVSETLAGYNDTVLKYGDRIILFDGVEVTSGEDIKNALTGHSVGDLINVSLYRKGKIIEVQLECFEKVPSGIDFGN